MKGKSNTPTGSATGWPRLRLAILALSLLGVGISLYLSTVHYANVPLVCLGAAGCETVNHSPYSEVAGIAVALLGLGGYVAILGLLWAENQGVVKNDEAALALFGVSLAGVLYSAYLTYVELFILRAICSWCVISALAMTAIFVLAVVRLRDAIDLDAPAVTKAAAKKKLS